MRGPGREVPTIAPVEERPPLPTAILRVDRHDVTSGRLGGEAGEGLGDHPVPVGGARGCWCPSPPPRCGTCGWVGPRRGVGLSAGPFTRPALALEADGPRRSGIRLTGERPPPAAARRGPSAEGQDLAPAEAAPGRQEHGRSQAVGHGVGQRSDLGRGGDQPLGGVLRSPTSDLARLRVTCPSATAVR